MLRGGRAPVISSEESVESYNDKKREPNIMNCSPRAQPPSETELSSDAVSEPDQRKVYNCCLEGVFATDTISKSPERN